MPNVMTPPTGLAASNITSSSVDLVWVIGNAETNWNIKYGIPGFDPLSAGTLDAATDNSSHTLSGLDGATDYDVWVQADCGVDGQSAWAGPFTFTTLCSSSNGTDTRTECAPFTWIDGNIYNSDENAATFTLTNQAGCDSIVTLNLTIDGTVDNTTDTRTECAPFTWIDGNTYNSDENAATFTLTNQAGCDSIVTLNLTIDGTVDNTTDTRTECAPFTWIDGNTYNSDENAAIFTLTNQAGCDSIVTLNLTIDGTVDNTTDTRTECAPFTWIDGNTYNSDENAATFTLTNQAGCDSIVTLNLTIDGTVDNTTDTRTECAPFTWIDGNTYNSDENAATFTLTNQAGCDSIVTLNLTIDGTVDNTTDTRTECAPFTWIDGNTYNSDENAATFTLTNQAGCDSIVTLNLTIDGTVDNTTDTRTECAPFTWIDGNTYNSDENAATFTLTNQAGCDSIATLNLIIDGTVDNTTDTRTECAPFIWIDGNTYNSDENAATFTLTNQAGCDSIVTLNLTIDGTVDNTTDTRTECAPFTWIDGNTYNSDENAATFTLTNQAGCDSIVTLNLTIDRTVYNTTDTRTECAPFTWIDGNTYNSDENAATFTLTNQAGCDSIVTLNLTID